MAIPRFVRPFTKQFINPVTRRFSGTVPGFAIITYVGRTSGHSISTPINVFHYRGETVFALTYGSDVNWVKNVLAAGWCDIRERGRTRRLVEPRLVRDPSMRPVPLPVRLFLRATGAGEYLAMRPAARTGTPSLHTDR